MIYLKLFLEFFKIGLFTFGGGYAMIPLIKETVLEYGWLTEGEFYDFIGVCETTPGPIAINMATYIGSIQGGLLGSIVSTLGVVLPSFVIIIIIVTVFKKILESKIFNNCLKGIKPVVLGLILSTGIMLVAKNLGYININDFHFDYISLIIIVVIALIYYLYLYFVKKKMSPIVIILISALLGILSMFI